MRTTIAAGSPAGSTSDPISEPHRAARAALADLGRSFGTLRCAGSRRLVELGVSMTHFHVLTLLRHHDAMSMGRLADAMGASMSAATGIIDRMEERGLIERVRVPDDRRVVVVRPTRTGNDLVDDAELLKSTVMDAALARLSDDQLGHLAVSAASLNAALREELDAQGIAPLSCSTPD
jgi:DNA-binding MarR family transcriptional regulator